jgi:hypothetical protein
MFVGIGYGVERSTIHIHTTKNVAICGCGVGVGVWIWMGRSVFVENGSDTYSYPHHTFISTATAFHSLKRYKRFTYDTSIISDSN